MHLKEWGPPSEARYHSAVDLAGTQDEPHQKMLYRKFPMMPVNATPLARAKMTSPLLRSLLALSASPTACSHWIDSIDGEPIASRSCHCKECSRRQSYRLCSGLAFDSTNQWLQEKRAGQRLKMATEKDSNSRRA